MQYLFITILWLLLFPAFGAVLLLLLNVILPSPLPVTMATSCATGAIYALLRLRRPTK